MITPTQPTVAELRGEIVELVNSARQQGYRNVDLRRRAKRYYHRSWPILVSYRNGQCSDELSVPMRDVSELGIGFLSSDPFEVGSSVFIKVFWYDRSRPRLPAVVRHVTVSEDGYIIGCEFVFGTDS